MKARIKEYIKTNPSKFYVFCVFYNKIIGRNTFKNKKDNRIDISSSLLKSCKIQFHGKNNKVFIHDKSRLINCRIVIRGNNNSILIGRNIYMVDTNIAMEDDNNILEIGDYTTIYGSTKLAMIEGTKIIIGEDCMLADGIHFRTGDSHSITDLDNKRINDSKDITIGNHVWIGTNSCCLKGIQIANNSIVGANSLVTKKFDEKNIIIAGNPAAFLKGNINWLRERI